MLNGLMFSVSRVCLADCNSVFGCIYRFRRVLGLCYITVKVSLLVVMEIGFFPLICGWWLDICSLVSSGAVSIILHGWGLMRRRSVPRYGRAMRLVKDFTQWMSLSDTGECVLLIEHVWSDAEGPWTQLPCSPGHVYVHPLARWHGLHILLCLVHSAAAWSFTSWCPLVPEESQWPWLQSHPRGEETWMMTNVMMTVCHFW